MTTFKLPNHLLTLEEWDDLPEEGYRWAELAEGVLQVSPSPAMKHQLASSELLLALGPTARVAGFRVVTDMDVLVDPVFPATVRRPDLSIVDLSIVELSSAVPERLVARNVVLAVEIVSPGSGHRDPVTGIGSPSCRSTPRPASRTIGSSTSPVPLPVSTSSSWRGRPTGGSSTPTAARW